MKICLDLFRSYRRTGTIPGLGYSIALFSNKKKIHVVFCVPEPNYTVQCTSSRLYIDRAIRFHLQRPELASQCHKVAKYLPLSREMIRLLIYLNSLCFKKLVIGTCKIRVFPNLGLLN